VPWVERVKQQNITAVISAHTLAEVFSGLTRIPTHAMIPPAKAYQLIETNIIGKVEIVALTANDYTDLISTWRKPELPEARYTTESLRARRRKRRLTTS
jgi:hypothetical protein